MSESLHISLVDESATLALGAELARESRALAQTHGLVIYLRGDLGAGKTTLTRGLLRALGIQQGVKSPTYTLVEPYEQADLTVYHFDLYRLQDAEELQFMGVRDYFRPGCLCVIEWPDRGREFLPSADFEVELSLIARGRMAKLLALSAAGELILGNINAKNISNIS